MKKMMILVSVLVMAATAYAKNIETKPFEGVKVNVPARDGGGEGKALHHHRGSRGAETDGGARL